jgi:hypothetical protein
MTAEEVIVAAYRKRGTTNAPSTTLKTAGLQDLQNMMASLSADGLTVPYFVTENFTLTIGQAVYTIGVTGDSPDLETTTGRPLKIVEAFIRISNIDYSVSVDMAKSQYNRLSYKDLESRPRRLYYDPQYPNGKIKFNYEADAAYDFHMVSEKPLVELAALATTISLSREMNEMLIYNLAIRLAPDKNIDLKPQVYIIAEQSMDRLQKLNAIDKLSDPVRLDNAIVYGGRRSMDIRSGDYR